MNTSAISMSNLGKKYRIRVDERTGTGKRAAFRRMALSPFDYLRTRLRAATAEETLWALKDISCEIQTGEVVGIIGRNGAGKSTLLKILSRITDPSEGQAVIRGRVNSLLEVGTGFHSELSGRENVYMSAAIHGLKKKEIDAKLDQIIDFSGIEKFMDTPVKRYSSGMYVRLAFAVAAHLEPEILIVDEVLAVGDASFQKQCLNKMQDVSEEGRTVVFVSHNMTTITRLCSRAFLLEGGEMTYDGKPHEAVDRYMQSDGGTSSERAWPDRARAPGNDIVRLKRVRVINEQREIVEACDIRKPVGIEVEYDVLQPGHVLMPALNFWNEEGVCAFVSQDSSSRGEAKSVGAYTSTVWLPGNFLSEGRLIVWVNMITPAPFAAHFKERDVVAFQVVDSLDGDSVRGDFGGALPGVVRPQFDWGTEKRA